MSDGAVPSPAMKRDCWEENLLQLIRRTSTDLPSDVEIALRRALKQERRGGRAAWVLRHILENAEEARRRGTPLCQDTGSVIFFFQVPVGFDTNMLAARARAAVSKATRLGYLRQNTVDSVSGSPYPTNIAHCAPQLHFQQGARKNVDVRLILKGGGCENVGRQYSLPDSALAADRDLEGVRRCVLNAVWEAQGQGCAPGILGVCIGGDRAVGYAYAKEQFLRKLSDRSPDNRLARLEERILKETRLLGIGPMGLGGRSAVLAVKIGAVSRLPACFFVTVSYMCWALRRRGAVFGPGGGLRRWLY